MKKVRTLKRKRVYEILAELYDHPLTIVEAPMGFGKTTAVKDFFQSKKSSPLWITFQGAEEATSLFWNKFADELGKLDESAALTLKSLGFPLDMPQIAKVLTVLNNMDLKEKTPLVIDDFHLSSDSNIAKFLLHLVAECVDNLHIVIITRDTTQLSFSELLAKGLCYVISQQYLKFSEQEVRSYCLMMTDTISEADVLKINEYTDGWISLIYLILLGLENGIPVGMNSSIDELVENVLFNILDEGIQNFLLKLSLMNDFTAKQALFVTQEEKTLEILRKLRKENAFVSYDEGRKTYKIHNVLLDFLRLKQHFAREELQALYKRLGEWHLADKDFKTAYACLYQAGAAEQILAHLNDPKNIRSSLSGFEGSIQMFESLPLNLLNKYPLAYLQHILLMIFSGDEERISAYTEKLENLKATYEQMENVDEAYRNRIIAESLIIKKFTYFNKLEPTSDSNAKIIRLLNGQQSWIMRREDEFTFGSPHLLYIYFRDQGSFQELTKAVTDKFRAYVQFADGCGTGSDYLVAAEYALETGDWRHAELNSLKAIYKARTKTQTGIIICATFNLIRLYILQGKTSAGLELLRHLEEEVLVVNNPIYNTTLDICKGYLQACLLQPEIIPCWLQTGDMTEADFYYQGIAFNYIVHGKAVLLAKKYIELEVLAESLNEYFSLFSNQLGFIHQHIFEAVAKYQLYGLDEGIAALEDGLLKGRADGIIMPFIENAPHLMEMLSVMVSRGANDEYLQKILHFAEKYKESLSNSPISKVQLSQREIEVLSLAAEGLSRDAIAARLCVSMGTVKTHLQNIYQKLEVNGKVSAIKIAQMHGLI
ncbi:LuxR C-terminal-related transcriptional regulator [Desulfosporosinus sp. PR]|uniref:LuxR C-terminal-related transcriptional regulator n=1 Tax=Candidatus Desulfosporosinus nitrosoreducens TaxID=3401928 RepID=UPI0027FA4AB7|nr:LuxR C-terminal-related transcriptional regulator [Desulfosporosinus sp. PR]MDQ7096473.1 LuxR C-terminal-related transcriptional regulator [Desulfosporosinus sp. PR]